MVVERCFRYIFYLIVLQDTFTESTQTESQQVVSHGLVVCGDGGNGSEQLINKTVNNSASVIVFFIFYL